MDREVSRFNQWLQDKPKQIKDQAAKYSPFEKWRIRDGAPYGITRPGTKVSIVGYQIDGSIIVLVKQQDKLIEAVEYEKKMCMIHGTSYEPTDQKLTIDSKWLKKEHKKPCHCRTCKKHAEIDVKILQHSIKEKGYVIHYEDFVDGYPHKTNIHTHGFVETYGHPDFQICLPLDHSSIKKVFMHIESKIKAGMKFVAGKSYVLDSNVSPLKLGTAISNDENRMLVRIIFPSIDEQNRTVLDDFTTSQLEGCLILN